MTMKIVVDLFSLVGLQAIWAYPSFPDGGLAFQAFFKLYRAKEVSLEAFTHRVIEPLDAAKLHQSVPLF
ncbi:hypothetical protein [Polaromonas sp. SM01]|uniref:hypothetical protein n=1 Tax=Polaromonas sp. SM01 TaxID=3085630 RepID=UPI00298122D5|nr:hypothetical protein [Polaromonas sp. SM01]MDW5442800.1 hypothetical protein [Polaromonas sp. SM01]